MGTVTILKGAQTAPKAERSQMDTLVITPKQVAEWRAPPFQRQLRVNDKVRALAEELKQTECIPGVLTLGRIGKDPTIYIVDGMHRTEAYKISGLTAAYADVRIVHFDDMAAMAQEFVDLQSALVKFRPDDTLKGLEACLPALREITDRCPFVGYNNVRRNDKSPILSMSATLRCWFGAMRETPTTVGCGSAMNMAYQLDELSAEQMIAFLNIAHNAWGRDPEYYRLWGGLNMMLCMWLWRKLVLDKARPGNLRHPVLTANQFSQCLTAISANKQYIDWLYGRVANERDRSPGFTRLKDIFVKRLSADGVRKVAFMQPGWASK